MYVNYLTASEVADVCRQKLKTKGLFEDLVVCWLGGGGVSLFVCFNMGHFAPGVCGEAHK